MAAAPNPKHATTDHVNYLIWRYLQENGFGEAAVKLEQKWNIDPRKLPFANNVGLKALQHLVQKGLEFNAIQNQLRNPESGDAVSALTLFFGTPEGRRLSGSLPIRRQPETPATSLRGPRKHGRNNNNTTNPLSLELPAAKRPRRSGTEASPNGDTMQVDQNGYHDLNRPDNESDTNNYSPADNSRSVNGMEIDDEPATPSPEPILTLNIGASKAIQIDQPVDLADKTSIHSLSSSNQAITHLAFNPQDPTILATGGEALARIWQTAKMAGPLQATQTYCDILPPSDDSYVSAEAWSPDGAVLAVASRNATTSQLAGSVSLWTSQGKCIEELPATQELVFKLRWNPTGTHLVGIASSGMTSTSIVVWEAESSTLSRPCEVQNELRDVVWTSDSQFAVCGKGIIATSGSLTADTIPLHSSDDPEVHSRTWTHILQDTSFSTNLIAADESGYIALIGRQGDIHSTREAHYGELTGLELRPSSKLTTTRADSTRLMATSGMEGTVKLWNAINLENLATLSFGGPASPVMSLSFTPSGHLLAAGNPNRIYVWDPDDMGPPKATWKREVGKGPQKKALPNGNNNGLNGHNNDVAMDYDSAIGDDAEDEGRSLSWDADGRKLAMGVGFQFIVVDFGP